MMKLCKIHEKKFSGREGLNFGIDFQMNQSYLLLLSTNTKVICENKFSCYKEKTKKDDRFGLMRLSSRGCGALEPPTFDRSDII